MFKNLPTMLALFRRITVYRNVNSVTTLLNHTEWNRNNSSSAKGTSEKSESPATTATTEKSSAGNVTGAGCGANAPNTKVKTMSWAIIPEIEVEINRQIKNELSAAFAFMVLESYFDNVSVGLPNFARLCKEQFDEELKHARILRDILIERGGKVTFCPLSPPTPQEWASPLEAMKTALDVEDKNLQSAMELLDLAAETGDVLTSRVLEHNVVGADLSTVRLMQKLLALLESAKSPVDHQTIDFNLGKELKSMKKKKE